MNNDHDLNQIPENSSQNVNRVQLPQSNSSNQNHIAASPSVGHTGSVIPG